MLAMRFGIALARMRGAEVQRNLIDNFEAVAVECDDFARMIGQDADAAEAQVDQNLRADSAFALHLALRAQVMHGFFAVVETDARQFAAFGFARAIAQRDARMDLKTSPGVMQVNENAAAGFGNCGERAIDGRVTIAGGGTEGVAGEAMGMDA